MQCKEKRQGCAKFKICKNVEKDKNRRRKNSTKRKERDWKSITTRYSIPLNLLSCSLSFCTHCVQLCAELKPGNPPQIDGKVCLQKAETFAVLPELFSQNKHGCGSSFGGAKGKKIFRNDDIHSEFNRNGKLRRSKRQCCGLGIFIPDPGTEVLHLRSRF
jgi:hypothetical protein